MLTGILVPVVATRQVHLSQERVAPMSSSGRFRVSLHVSHPLRSAEDICTNFSLRTRYARSAGEPRSTIQGTPLNGKYAKTDVSFQIGDGVISNDDVLVSDFIDGALDSLPLSSIDDIILSGGSCFFFLGVYAEGNLLCDFHEGLLFRLASHRIGLKIDFYGGPDP